MQSLDNQQIEKNRKFKIINIQGIYHKDPFGFKKVVMTLKKNYFL
jgi:hypothetical protein